MDRTPLLIDKILSNKLAISRKTQKQAPKLLQEQINTLKQFISLSLYNMNHPSERQAQGI